MSELFRNATIGSSRDYTGGVHEAFRATEDRRAAAVARGAAAAQGRPEDRRRTTLRRESNVGDPLGGSHRAFGPGRIARPAPAWPPVESRSKTAPGGHKTPEAWRRGQRVCDRAMDLAADQHAHRAGVRVSTQWRTGVADAGAPGLELPAAERACDTTRRSGDPEVESQTVAGSKKTLPGAVKPSSSSTNRD